MRVTEQTKYANLLSRVQTNQSRLQDAIDQIGSGRRVDASSDDPTAVAQLDRLDRANARHETWLKVGEAKHAELMAADNALDAANETLVRGREVAMTFGSGVHSQEQLDSAADEVAKLRDSLAAAANSTFDGRHIFGGVAEDTPPFDASGTFVGSTETRSVEVGYNARVDQPNGSAIFGGGASGVDAFQALTDLEAALRAGDQTAARDLTDTLRAAHGQINDARQSVGVDLDTIESARAFSENVVLRNTERSDELISTDIAAASTQLAQANTALQAVVESASRMNNLQSLLKL